MPGTYHEPVQFLPDPETGCWNWNRTLDQHGYGQMRVQRKLHPAHRFFYEHLVGPVPEGLDLDHLCRNPRCVNPAHLEPVTRAENCRRGLGTRFSDEEIELMRTMPGTVRAVAAHFGCAHSHVVRVRQGRARA